MWKLRESEWKKLDNAAKIFPALAGREDAEVFRVACQLRETVDPVLLQAALDAALEEYPSFTDTLRRGMFWYYLESTRLRPTVREETETPLQPMRENGLLISVSYYRTRINFEIFHVLADGTGAFVFLKALVGHYLKLAHSEELDGVSIETGDIPGSEKESDGFTQYFEPDRGSSTNFEFLGNKAGKDRVYRFDGPKTPDCRQLVTEASVSAAKIREAASADGATITQFLCAELILAIRDTMQPRDRQKSVAVAVPVNLRNYFRTRTVRNFFGMIQVTYDFSAPGEHDRSRVIAEVRAAFERELTEDNMRQKIASQGKMERHPIVRICPLFLKDRIMAILQGVSMKRRTIVLSNMGRIVLQPELTPYVEAFDFFNSSSKRQICLCTFGDRMNVSFSGVLNEHETERSFFRRLAAFDEGIAVSANYSAHTDR